MSLHGGRSSGQIASRPSRQGRIPCGRRDYSLAAGPLPQPLEHQRRPDAAHPDLERCVWHHTFRATCRRRRDRVDLAPRDPSPAIRSAATEATAAARSSTLRRTSAAIRRAHRRQPVRRERCQARPSTQDQNGADSNRMRRRPQVHANFLQHPPIAVLGFFNDLAAAGGRNPAQAPEGDTHMASVIAPSFEIRAPP
jgi:hypothetical protein